MLVALLLAVALILLAGKQYQQANIRHAQIHGVSRARALAHPYTGDKEETDPL